MTELIWFFLCTLGLGFAVYLNRRRRYGLDDEIRAWAKSEGYNVVSVEVTNFMLTTKEGSHMPEAQVILSRFGQDIEFPGRLKFKVGPRGLQEVMFFPKRAVSNAERREQTEDAGIDEERLAMLYIEDDYEARVLGEVNRRLDNLTSQANWMEPFDLDGSGHIDEEEWSILRGNIMAEVRGEIGDPGVLSAAAPAGSEFVQMPAESDDEQAW